MATKTSNYEFNKPEQNDFYDVDVQNENWDKVDEELSEFDDSGVTEDVKSFPDFLSKFVTGNKVAITLRNLKAGLQFVLHAGQIVNNCVTDNAGLPLSAAQGKALMDKYTQLYSDLNTTNNNLSNAGIPTVKKTTDLYAIKKSGFYYYDAGATNAPMSSRGGMIVANYLSDSWISLTVVPYALSKIYTNTKYNNTWVGWAESATKNDLLISASGTGPTDWTALETVENMPFKIWNVTKASTSKGAPAGCYDYGTLIALVATSATGDRWRNTLIYLPDNNNNVGNKVYVRSGISTKWLAISGTDVNSVS